MLPFLHTLTNTCLLLFFCLTVTIPEGVPTASSGFALLPLVINDGENGYIYLPVGHSDASFGKCLVGFLWLQIIFLRIAKRKLRDFETNDNFLLPNQLATNGDQQCITQADGQLTLLLPQLPECWNCSGASPHPALPVLLLFLLLRVSSWYFYISPLSDTLLVVALPKSLGSFFIYLFLLTFF